MRAVNLIITDLCVFEVKQGGGLVLIELHPGVTVDDIRAKTGAPFDVALKLTCSARCVKQHERLSSVLIWL